MELEIPQTKIITRTAVTFLSSSLWDAFEKTVKQVERSSLLWLLFWSSCDSPMELGFYEEEEENRNSKIRGKEFERWKQGRLGISFWLTEEKRFVRGDSVILDRERSERKGKENGGEEGEWQDEPAADRNQIQPVQLVSLLMSQNGKRQFFYFG